MRKYCAKIFNIPSVANNLCPVYNLWMSTRLKIYNILFLECILAVKCLKNARKQKHKSLKGKIPNQTVSLELTECPIWRSSCIGIFSFTPSVHHVTRVSVQLGWFHWFSILISGAPVLNQDHGRVGGAESERDQPLANYSRVVLESGEGFSPSRPGQRHHRPSPSSSSVHNKFRFAVVFKKQ